MSLQTHEAYELNHLLMGCYDILTCMGAFLKDVRDPELKTILEKQLSAHVQDYNIKVEFAKNGASSGKLKVPAMPQKATFTPKAPQAGAPNINDAQFDDRAIATIYLLTLKNNGKGYASSAFETDNLQLRAFLEDAFTMCSHHAFEVAGWLRKNGYYPGEPATNTYLQALGQTYDKVPEMAQVH
ncbi:spore coat protein [Alicyclobacillus mengziensis]|uniref:Spore coat protein n=1 Tax=Alicyclobacillus mengziensis TaxID=2931921 RepID=A0A9X7W0Q2_9BACL|nr:spore coat protein [Alicyclobacillus mengziensis]QSO48628.1 spore coat protein [Alicyclobacillus mengziensis]